MGRSSRQTARGPGPVALSAWVRLLKAHGLILREVRRAMPRALTLPQFDVLAQLYRRPEGMTPGELTRELLVTAGNVTGIVRRLRSMGLVDRRPVPGDGRAVRLRLTPRGRRAMAREIPRHRRDVARILAGVSHRDKLALRDLLGRVTTALEETGSPPAAR